MIGLLPKNIQRRIDTNSGTDCWLWIGSIDASGYGQIEQSKIKGKRNISQAHRLVYEILVGDITNYNLMRRRSCLKICVNPDHLKPYTVGECAALTGQKEFCCNGHEFTEENTRIRQDKGTKQCVSCQVERHLMSMFSMSLLDYDNLLASQRNGCAICGSLEPGGGNTRFAVDHNRSCCPDKKSCGFCVRGLLCFNCNTGLGSFRDSSESLLKALEYLNKNGEI